MPSTTTTTTPPNRPKSKHGVVMTLVRTLLFHVFAMLNGLLLVALLGLTAGGAGLLLLCTLSASTRSSRLFVAWLWRNELWINALVGDNTQTEPERLEQERARGLRREASQQGGRMAAAAASLPTTNSSASLPRSSSTRGREVTKTVMAFSILYFLLFKGLFNVIFSTVPLLLWGIVTIHLVPSLAPDSQMLMADDTTGRVFVALATSFFAYQIGVAAATMSVYMSEKIQELLFHPGDARRSSVRSPLLASDSFRQSQGYVDHTQSMHRDMFSFDERDELLRGHNTSGGSSSGTSSSSTSGLPPPPPPPPPPPLHGPGFPYDGFRPLVPIPPMPPMAGDPRRPGSAYESAFRAEPVTREVEFCGVKVTIQSQPNENDRAHTHHGGRGRGSGSFRFPQRGGGRGGGGMGRGGFYHPGMASGIVEPPMAYGSFGPPFESSDQGPEIFARIVTEDEQARSASSRAPPMASPAFGRSCSSSPRGQRRHGGRKGGGRYRRSDSFDSGHPGAGRFAPDVDLKHGAHTRLWEALDLRPSAPNLPDAHPVARPSSNQYPLSSGMQSSGLHKTQSDNGYRSDHGYTDDSDTPSQFRKFEMFATKQRLKEQSRQLKEAAKQLKREYKEQLKRNAQARTDEHERFAAEQKRYAAEQVRFAREVAKEEVRYEREHAKEEERRAKDFARSARALGQRNQTDTQLKQAEIQRKQAEGQRQQAEDQRKQAEDQRRQSMEAKAARTVQEQLRFQASPPDAVDEPKRDALLVEELSASYRERVQEIQIRDEYAIDIERAAQEEVERQRRELEAAGAPPETKPFTVSRVISSDSASDRESGRLRGRRVTNSSDFLLGTSDTGLFDPDSVSRSRRPSSSRVINFANPYQTGLEVSDTEIQATWGSVSRSDDGVMGLSAYVGMSLPSSPALITGLQSPRYRGGVDYDQLTPPTSPTSSSYMTNSFIDHVYNQLSPTNSLRDADFPSEEFQQVYRSIRYTDENRVGPSQLSALPHFEDVPGQRDKVHFCSYAPPSVYPSKQSFRFSVWAFLLNQRHEMRERAEAADPDAQQLSMNTKMVVRRGAIVHVTLEVPEGFKILSGATQGFPWEGKISNVGYDIECTENAGFGQVLFKASIVVGTEVAVLRSYVIVSSRKLERGELEAKLLDSELEVLEMTYQEVPYPSLELKEFVGSGYFGDAYRASYNGEDVVVKTIRASEFGETNDQILKEFQHEAAVLSMFGHHPCVVPFVGASTDMRYPLSLITKYLPFGSLEDNLKKPEMNSSLSTRQRTAMLKDAAAGLLNIHEGGFIHRDVAARNCLVDSDLRVKICDFGLCRRVNAYGGSLMKDSVGPIKYMAPESLQPPHSFSYESDAWMFGVLMWETYTATPPFQNKTPIQAGMDVLKGERLPVPMDLPEDLQELMEACFHEVPSERPSMAQILEELDRATAPRPLGKNRSPAMASGHASTTTPTTGSNGHAPPRGLGRHDLPIQV